MSAREIDSSYPAPRLRLALWMCIGGHERISGLPLIISVILICSAPSNSEFPTLNSLERESRSYLSRSAIVALHRGALGCCGKPHNSFFVLNPSAKWVGEDSVEAFVPKYVIFSKRLWRSDSVARFRFHRAVTHGLRFLANKFKWEELIEILVTAGLSGEAASAFALKLLDRELVQPESFTDGLDQSPATGYLRCVGLCSTPAARAVQSGLESMENVARALAVVGTSERMALVQQSEELFQTTWKYISQSSAPEGLTLIREDGYFPHPCAIGEAVMKVLLEVATTLRPYVAMRVNYRKLRDYFVETFGVRGECHDVVTFLCGASRTLSSYVPEESDHESAQMPIARVQVPISAFIQLATEHVESVDSGDTLAVVNHVYAGCGWLSARHASGNSNYHGTLRESVRNWLREVNRPREPADLLVCADCNDLQAHPRLTDRAIVWPTEPCLTSRKILASQLVLCYDQASDLLELFDANSNPVAPVYLGGAIPSPAWGARYWLTVLADPYEVRWPMERWIPTSGTTVELESRPRHTIGRVVMSRAMWCMRVERVRRTWYRRKGAARLLDVAMDCNNLGIPRVIFANKSLLPNIPISSNAHKPLWVDTRNPFCLDMLNTLLDDAEWILFTEALPDARTTWTRLGGRRHTAEFLVEMMI